MRDGQQSQDDQSKPPMKLKFSPSPRRRARAARPVRGTRPRSGRTTIPSLLLGLLAACASPGENAPDFPDEPVAPSPSIAPSSVAGAKRRAVAAIRADEFEQARSILDDLLVSRYVAQAQDDLDRGMPEDGLLWVDRALDLAPRSSEVLLLHARGNLMLAEKNIATGSPAPFVEGALQDALEAFSNAGDSIQALLGGARSALLLGQNGRALRLARDGNARLDALRAAGTALPALDVDPSELLARTAYAAFVDARRADDASADTLFAEAEDALSIQLGQNADAAWVWSTLASLYEWHGQLDRSLATLAQALDRLPDDADLLASLVRVARVSGGREQVIRAVGEFESRHPSISAAPWTIALERFEAAIEGLLDDAGSVQDFEATEQGFARIRAMDASYTDAALGYELMCRDGAGWSHFHAGSLEEATRAFLSMDELRPRGMEWSIEGRLLSGVMGLEFVGGKYNEDKEWLAAAGIFEILQDYQPDKANHANNTAFFLREAAVELAFTGDRLCRASRGLIDNPETLAALRRAADLPEDATAGSATDGSLAAAAEQYVERARQLMRRSLMNYQRALTLAPEDVRVINDTALITVYYLREDDAGAELLLRHAVELGRQQLASSSLDKDARWELENAWGDAHQNLGVLHLMLRNDAQGARPWFERAGEIGPDPRPVINELWLPLLEGTVDPSIGEDLAGFNPWAPPCTDEQTPAPEEEGR